MSFFYIEQVPFYVVNSLKSNPELQMKVTAMHKDNNGKASNYIYNGGYLGKKFTVELLIEEDETYKGKDKLTLLNNWIKLGSNVRVVTDTRLLPNSTYVMTEVSEAQTLGGVVNITVTFTENTYDYSPTYTSIPNTYQITTENEKTTTAQTSTTNNDNILSCELPLQVGSENTKCVKLLQTLLKSKGYYTYYNNHFLKIDGVYDKYTKMAVLNFQRKYKTKYGLKENGIFDTLTRKALTEV